MRALAAVAFGIGLGRSVSVPVWGALAAAVLGLALARLSRGLSLYLALAAAALLYAGARRAGPVPAEVFQAARFSGVVVEEPGHGTGLRYSVALLPPLEGRVVLWLRDSAVQPGYGDVIKVATGVRPLDFPRNPGLTDFNRVLEERGVVGSATAGGTQVRIVERGRGSPWMRLVVMPVRRYVRRTIGQLVPEPEAGLMLGLLLGGRQGLGPEARQAFTDSGLVHLLAVSGLHMGIVVVALLLVLGAVGIRGWWRFGIGAAVVLLYAAVAGLSAAPVRAGIMAFAALLSVPIQRRVSHTASLAVAGLGLLLADPLTLFDVGAQLSFMATLGIVLTLNRLEIRPARPQLVFRLMSRLAQALVVSLAATAATAPLMLHHFFRVQPLAFLSTLVAAPVVSLALPLGLAVLSVNLVHGGLAGVLAAALWAVSWGLLKLNGILGGLRWAMFEPGKLPWLGVFWVYAVLLAALNWRYRPARLAATGLTLAGLSVLVWNAALVRPGTQVVFLDPRKGDAVLLEDTLGRRVVFDAGIDRAGVLRDYLRSRGIHCLDAVILSHPDRDHYGGLLDLDRSFRIGQVLVPPLSRFDPAYAELLDTLRQRGTQVVPVAKGSHLTGFGFGLEFLWPEPAACRRYEQGRASTNAVSLVARVEHAGYVMLLTGDMEALELTPAHRLRADLLKSPHHGSRKGNRPELYRLVQPSSVVVMGRYPTPARLESRLAGSGTDYVNTRRDGGLTLRFEDGAPVLLHFRIKQQQ